jgi:hypothetical protein
MYESLLQTPFGVARESSTVYTNNPVVADDQSPGITISTASYIEATLDGFTNGTGTVTLTGTDENDQVLVETITFVGNGRLVSDSSFKTITRVQTANLIDETSVGSLTLKTTTQTGEEQPVHLTKSNIVGRLARPGTAEAQRLIGTTETRRGGIVSKPNVDVEIGDKITLGSESWEVTEILHRYMRVNQVRHWVLVLKELRTPV